MPTIIESPQEFTERHGGKAAMVKVKNRWLLPDGASMTHDGFNPAMYEPPDDPASVLQVRATYHEARVEQLESDFHRLKRALLGAVDDGMSATFRWPADGRYGPPHPTGTAALRHLKRLVHAERVALAQVQEEIDGLPESIEARRRAEQDHKDRQFIDQQRSREQSAIDAISI